MATQYDMAAMDWDPVRTRLGEGIAMVPGSGGPDRHTCWLTTVNADGSPHVAGLGATWAHDSFFFETGGGTVKGRNIARDPRVALSVSVKEFDLTVYGDAARVTDPGLVSDLAARWAAEGWPCRVDDSGIALTADFSAQSAGPPPWFVYRIEITRATALECVDPGRATSWTF